MTLNQLISLTEQELDLCLYIVNVTFPLNAPKMELEPRHLTWFKDDVLIRKLLDAFPRLKPEGHATYTSLMEKLSVKVEITPVPTSTERSSEIPPQPPEVIESKVETEKTGSTKLQPTGSI